MPFWRQILKWLGMLALTLGLVIGGTLAGWRLAGETSKPTAIGRVSIEVQPSTGGEIEAFIPVADWGLRADAFDAPLRLRAELRSIDRQAVRQAASQGDSTVAVAAENDLRAGARSAVIRAAIWGGVAVLLLLILATLIWRGIRPRWAILAIGIVLTGLLYGGSALRIKSTFDTTAFESPTYFAKGSEIGRILELASDARFESDYGNNFSSIVSSISTVLTVGRDAQARGIEFYAGSDLHANALVIDPVSELVGPSPLLLAGDFGQRGGEAESRLLAPRVAALGTRVVAVSGNHDTSALMKKLASEGVTVLDRRGRLRPDGRFRPPPVIEVAGLSVAGYGDPLEYDGGEPDGANRPVTENDLEDPAAAVAAWRKDLLDWFIALPSPPSVLMVHQNGLAQWLAASLNDVDYGAPLTIVTGHDHRQHVDRYGNVIVVDAGTLGAGGIFGAGQENVGIARLRFTETAALDSVDLIAVEPISGAARATRVVIDTMCPGEERCRVGADAEPDPEG